MKINVSSVLHTTNNSENMIPDSDDTDTETTGYFTSAAQ